MSRPDPLATALRSERDALAERAPPQDFSALMRRVETRGESRLQRTLFLAAAVPTLLLFLGGLAALLAGGDLLSGLPLFAVALWLLISGGVDPPPVAVRHVGGIA